MWDWDWDFKVCLYISAGLKSVGASMRVWNWVGFEGGGTVGLV